MGQVNNRRIIHTFVVLIALICMWVPTGVTVQSFEATPSGAQKEILSTCSFFDTALLTNGNWYPFAVAVLSAVLLVCVILTFFVDNKILYGVVFGISAVALLLSFSPFVFYAKEHYTRIAMLISYLLACSALFGFQQLTGHNFREFEDEDEE